MYRRGISSEARRNDADDDDSSSTRDVCNHSSNDECDSSSDDSHHDDSSSSDDESEGSIPNETLFQHTAARSVVRRRAVSPLENRYFDDTRDESVERNARGNNNTTMRSKRDRTRQHSPNFFQECFAFYADACPCFCNRRANTILLISFLLWFGIRFHDALKLPERDPMTAIRKHNADSRARLRNDVRAKDKLRPLGFWGEAQQKLEELMPNSRPRKRSRKGEALQQNCERPEWQKQSFPTCNQIHEFNLQEDLGLRGRSRRSATSISAKNKTPGYGYVGAGLWRTVWKIQSHGHVPVVLKMMKGEHEVDHRNMERHRRDALSMERLTASPHVVSIYGHCGNTVLTEHLPRGLDAIIYNNGDKKQNETVATRQTPLGRLRLALDVARGVAAIHDLEGGPIIHADIQAKQFLVDPQGVVKLNDFNRCRFMAHHNESGIPCTLTIPSAPGGSRSPEEYLYRDLTEKLDIFSTGHVLYGILTGVKPWDELWGSQIKKLVKAGRKPPILDKKYLQIGTSDASLANLIDLAYEFDPQDRISASKLVSELEMLVAAKEAKQSG